MKQNIAIKGICFLIALSYYLLNHSLPYTLDDFGYAYMCTLDKGFDYDYPISSFEDIIQSQWIHYLIWGGRSIIHIIVQFLCSLNNKIYSDFLLSFLFVPWILLIGKISMPEKKICNNLLTFISFGFLFWLCNTAQMSFYCSVAFGINYLYGSFICLLAIYLFTIRGGCNTIILSIIAFLAGWSHESFAIGTGAYLLAWIIQYRSKMNWKKYISFSFFCLGLVFLVFSPANFIRAEVSATAKNSWLLSLPYFAIFIVGLIVVSITKKNIKKTFVLANLPLLAAWTTSLLFIFLLGIKGVSIFGRMMIGVQLFGFILFIRTAQIFSIDNIISKIAPIFSIVFIFFLLETAYLEKKQGDEIRNFYSICEKSQDNTINYQIKKTKISPLFRRYVFIFAPDEFWEQEYSKRYKKNISLTYQQETDKG